ncbi:TrlF family AAA-like ATPase [Paenibacillus sp. PvR133]|uniref:TrlF family AAA-like ATPase n=1 Tax=unclassified Paenibacillus TaxID=185978 RepID=UPI001AE94BBD|nr:hypothetical protein [Paenibacillus sp. PvR133]MBP1172920.1 ABC-type lipoprotein export system ATPase subunit/allophanate hydrolase subunit 1 [Paenibacillus sp. PvR133]
MNQSVGSTWRRWDLHVHTPESVLNMQYSFDNKEESAHYKEQIWEKYIDKLESADATISVIGITDYCSVDGYERMLAYKSEGRLRNIDLILANVEFRIVPITDKNKAINVHCIFSNELVVQDIKRFLEELKYEYGGSKYKCNKNDLIELGIKYKPELQSDVESYKEGVKQFKVNMTDLRNLIETDQRYKDKVFIVASNSSSDGISGLKDNAIASTRQELYRSVDFIFSGNDNDQKYFLGRGVDSKEEVIRKYGGVKACLHGSDAHDFNKLFKPDLDRFCWIKGEPTFAGLRQLLFEPDTRVKIQKDEPDSKKNIYSLKKIKLNSTDINQELSFQSVELEFNKNLVAVIGGKGSGKTAVLDLIANCYKEYDRSRHYDLKGKPTISSNEDQNSFVQRIEKECPGLEVSLEYLDNQSFFSKKISEENFFANGQIRYLPQGKIEEVAGNTKALHKDIQQLIFSHLSKREDSEYRSYLERDEKIIQTNREISTLIGEIDTLITETSPEVLEGLIRQLEIKKGEQKDRELRLLAFNGTLTQEEEEAALKATEKVRELEMQYEKSKEFISGCENLIKELDEFQITTNAKVDSLNQNNTQLVMETVPHVDFNDIITVINKNKAYATIRKQDSEEQREKYSDDIKKFTGKQNEQASLLREKDSIEKNMQEITERISEMEKKQLEFGIKVKDLNDKYEGLLLHYKSQKNSYDRIIEIYKSLEKDILQNIDFKAEVRFDKLRFQELADDLFDKRKLADDFIDQCSTTVIDFLEKNITFALRTDNSVLNFLRKNKSLFDYLKWLTSDYCQLDTKVYFNGVELFKLSVGQKGAVILKLYLADGDYPIILDQPEDNLDNRFISEELLSTFRKAKEKRQIIIATHNANLVVNSDAEQIIIADFLDNKIRYRAGSIENATIRKEVASLLEGGEEAFKQRESKYGFSRNI